MTPRIAKCDLGFELTAEIFAFFFTHYLLLLTAGYHLTPLSDFWGPLYGKKPERYKPVTPGTVFYNPMRIMIGSIAMVDEDDTPGITSPDYVVFKGKQGKVDSRWFYYWLRSSFGEHCITSLARGAVRERMLFNRLAEGKIELPSYEVQKAASKQLAMVKPMKAAIEKQLSEIELLPSRLLAQAFGEDLHE